QLAFLGEALAQVEWPGDDRGESLMVTPAAAETIGMALHELATNALKYGALAVPEGRVRLDWERAGDVVRIGWTERGGPPVAGEPDSRGFGSRLIAEMPRVRLGAEV
ncbi:hypothetical protein ACNJU8_21110, partial [Mycobacterium tuberculosis]